MNEPTRYSVRSSLASRFVTMVIVVLLMSAIAASAQTICHAGHQVVTTVVDLTETCTITGSLTINGGMVRANFSGDPTAKLRVEGDVAINGTGILWIDGGIFEIQQDHNGHRQMSTTGDAKVILRNTTVVLNQGVGVKYVVHDASDRSQMFVIGSRLDRTRSWMLSNFSDNSALVAIATGYVPSEIYITDASTIRIGDRSSNTGVWMDFDSGATGAITLPVQPSVGSELHPFSWRVGRSTPGLFGVNWELEIADAWVGLGLQSHTGSQITVFGRGAPSSGEIKIAYNVKGGTESIAGLRGGLQNMRIGGNQLLLQNVNLGPIAWQVYAHDNATLTINSSIVNEIGAATGGHINIHNSILQFGSIVSLGGNAASIAAHDSRIHSQSIEAVRDGIVNIHNSAVFGAAVVVHEPSSSVNFRAGALLRNEPCSLVLDAFVTPQGIPVCNPFLAPDAAVTRAGSGTVSCEGTFDCTW